MIYLVTGYMRSGTSMMMGALVDGGMDCLHDPARMALNDAWGDEDYLPNPAFFEPSRKQINEHGFPRQHDGKLIKVLYGGIPNLAPMKGGYRVVMMLRDPEEIRQSFEAFFVRQKTPAWLVSGYQSRMDLTHDHLHNRRDVRSVTVFQYRDVVADPEAAFTQLRDDSWPIDPQVAARHVRPSLCRFRRESLEVGI